MIAWYGPTRVLCLSIALHVTQRLATSDAKANDATCKLKCSSVHWVHHAPCFSVSALMQSNARNASQGSPPSPPQPSPPGDATSAAEAAGPGKSASSWEAGTGSTTAAGGDANNGGQAPPNSSGSQIAKLPAIIGGSVGGSIALLLLLVSVGLYLQRRHAKRSGAGSQATDFDGNPDQQPAAEQKSVPDLSLPQLPAVPNKSAHAGRNAGQMALLPVASTETSTNVTLFAQSTLGTTPSAGAGMSSSVSSGGGMPSVAAALSAEARPAPPMPLPCAPTQTGPAQSPVQQDSGIQRQQAPPLSGTVTTSHAITCDTMPHTVAEPDMRSKVSTALHNMAEQEPPALFAGRFQLLSEQCQGGQAVVHFARDARGSLKQFAIKCAAHSIGIAPSQDWQTKFASTACPLCRSDF